MDEDEVIRKMQAETDAMGAAFRRMRENRAKQLRLWAQEVESIPDPIGSLSADVDVARGLMLRMVGLARDLAELSEDSAFRASEMLAAYDRLIALSKTEDE